LYEEKGCHCIVVVERSYVDEKLDSSTRENFTTTAVIHIIAYARSISSIKELGINFVSHIESLTMRDFGHKFDK